MRTRHSKHPFSDEALMSIDGVPYIPAVLVGGGYAHIIAALRLARELGPGKVALFTRERLNQKLVDFSGQDVPASASISTPGRVGLFHYSDVTTGALLIESLMMLLELDPELTFYSHMVDYIIRKDSAPRPDSVFQTYSDLRKIYGGFLAEAPEHVRARCVSLDEFFTAVNPSNVAYLDDVYQQHVARIARTLEGRLDITGSRERLIQQARDAGVLFYEECNVKKLSATSDGLVTLTGEHKDFGEECFTTSAISVGAWYNTAALWQTAYPTMEDPNSYRVKVIVDLLIPVDCNASSFFVGLNEKGCMLAIDDREVIQIGCRMYYQAKATSVKPTNVRLLNNSSEVEGALREIRGDKAGLQTRSEEIVSDICSVVRGLTPANIKIVGSACQVVVTNKLTSPGKTKIFEAVTEAMHDPSSALNIRNGIGVYRIEVDCPDADLSVKLATYNMKLAHGAKTGKRVADKIVKAARNYDALLSGLVAVGAVTVHLPNESSKRETKSSRYHLRGSGQQRILGPGTRRRSNFKRSGEKKRGPSIFAALCEQRGAPSSKERFLKPIVGSSSSSGDEFAPPDERMDIVDKAAPDTSRIIADDSIQHNAPRAADPTEWPAPIIPGNATNKLAGDSSDVRMGSPAATVKLIATTPGPVPKPLVVFYNGVRQVSMVVEAMQVSPRRLSDIFSHPRFHEDDRHSALHAPSVEALSA
ncbi:MAG: hypothetical protein COB66_04815 [Coxiella sp. (in: Bacteria)]|nr:MAG: hypothetical protein COB66_04815 [Coxiella sp. (in: g-proteobacteria)]